MPLVEQVIINGLVSRKAPFMSKNKFGLALIAMSGLLFLTATIFLIIAGYSWLLIHYTAPAAALICAAAVYIAGATVALTGYLSLKKRPAPRPANENEINQIVTLIAEAVDEEWAKPIQENPKTALLLATVGGFMAGDYLH